MKLARPNATISHSAAMDPYSEPKRAKSESQDGSVSWTSRPVAYSSALRGNSCSQKTNACLSEDLTCSFTDAKQRRAEARARGRSAFLFYIAHICNSRC